MARDNSRLITFPPSVDSETTRLILAYHNEPAVEVRQSAVGSFLRILRHRVKIPIFLGHGSTVSPSLAIAEHLDNRIAPALRLTGNSASEANKIAELWQELHHDMGVWIAQWSYYFILQDRDLALSLLTKGVPGWQATMDRMAFPGVRWIMRRGLKLGGREVALAAQKECRRVFGEVAAALEGNGDYLVGGRMTLADIGFAACAAPIMLSDRYHGALPAFDDATVEMQEFATELRDHAAGRYATRLYGELTNPVGAD